jgi:3,4-dihydroxy 2-butanone 4-phosphate synthase/GTP cyclohydrolase II
VLGRRPDDAELYLAHFLGTGTASRFLLAMRRNPHMPASLLAPRAARSNRAVFYTRSGRSRSLAEVLHLFEAKLTRAQARFSEPGSAIAGDERGGDYSWLDPRLMGDISIQFPKASTASPLGMGSNRTGPAQDVLRAAKLWHNIISGQLFTAASEGEFEIRAGIEQEAIGTVPSRQARPGRVLQHNVDPPPCRHIEMCYLNTMTTPTITRIRDLVDSGAYTKAGIARAAGLHANTLRDASEPDWNPTAETLAKLQKFLDANDDTPVLVGIEEIIDEARNGRMYILVDDEDRENEGDLIIPAQMATPSAINFMATHGRGLICLALDKARVDQLGLQPMSRNNKESMQTAFTVSIEAREGVTTGISAADRARTVSVAIDATKGPDDIVTPGHVFPLMARDGGTLVRAGHTEAAVDISRLAGLNPSGVICEIMNEDGTMARLDDLVTFARRHNLKIGTIRDLIAYRMRHDHLVERIDERSFESDYGGQWRLITYRNTVSDDEAYVLQKGHVVPGEPTLARVHPISLFNDILGAPGPRQGTLQRAMGAIGEHGSGVIVILTQRVGSSGEWSRDEEHRNIGIGSQILADLGIDDMVLLTNSQPDYVALDGYGLSITDTKPIPE